ncbi:MAG: hypothetical protein J6S49_09770 [Erysipelotrichaceae bacterium]|nr:hypothetical protein [Erysipelotrichaceae bacterium]
MFELHRAQMFMYFADKQGAGQAALLTGSVLLPRKIEISKLQDAANELFRENDALRAVFVEKDEKVYQDVEPYVRREFPVLHFDSKEELDKYGEVYGTIPLKLPIRVEGSGVSKERWKNEKPSLELVKNIAVHEVGMFFTKLRMGKMNVKPAVCEFTLLDLPDCSGAMIKIHHIVADAWTILLIANQLLSLLNGEAIQSFDYSDFIEDDKKYYLSSRYERDRAYMESEYEKCPEPTWLWPERYKTLVAKRQTRKMDKELSDKINEFCDQHKTTPYILFLSAVALYMRKKLGRDKFYTGSVSLNRSTFKEKNTVGMFVMDPPVLMEIDGNDTYLQLIDKVNIKSIKAFRHCKGMKRTPDSKNKLFDIWVSFQNATLDADPTAIITQYYCNYCIDTTILSIEDRLSEGQFKLIFDHNIKVSDEEAEELFDAVICELNRIIENPEKVIDDPSFH